MSTRNDLLKTLQEIEEVGRGEEVNGVYALVDEHGVVYADGDGNPVTPDDSYWNNEKDVAARLAAKSEQKKS